MPLIAPDICRYTIVGTLAGQDCMNIFDIRIGGDTILTRNELIYELAGDLLNQWDDHVMPLLVNDYTAVEVRWVDLDTAGGSTGSRSSTDGNSWPKTGTVSGSPLPNNTYAKMVKNLEGKNRRQRNGTLRLGGLAETYTEDGAPNTIMGSTRTLLNNAFEALKDGINEGWVIGDANLVVVHTVDGEFDGYSEIAQFTCAPVVGTIRRRMPGYGT